MKRHRHNPTATRTRTSERGATIVEYALLVALFCGAASAGIGYVRDQARGEMADTAAAVGEPIPSMIDDGPLKEDGGDVGGSAGEWEPPTTTTSTTTTATTTTTTPPTTTTAPSTTTTPPTTTTAAPAPTTTAPPSSQQTGWSSNATLQNRNKWNAAATVTVYGTDGKPFATSAGIRVRVVQVYRSWDGTVGERSWETTGNLNANGTATFTDNSLNTGANNQEPTLAMRYEVIGISYYWPNPPAVLWDGAMPSVVVEAPGS